MIALKEPPVPVEPPEVVEKQVTETIVLTEDPTSTNTAVPSENSEPTLPAVIIDDYGIPMVLIPSGEFEMGQETDGGLNIVSSIFSLTLILNASATGLRMKSWFIRCAWMHFTSTNTR